MSIQVVTNEDLQNFKVDLLQEIKKIISEQTLSSSKAWLKSNEVRTILKVSHAKLQTLRINGSLPFTMVGGTYYYCKEDIEKLLEKH